MSKFNKRMQDIFDVEPQEIVDDSEQFENEYGLQEYIPADEQQSTGISTVLEKDLKDDYDVVRDNITDLLSKGTMALDDMLEIARQSEKARDFEVATAMIKTLVESSKDLLEVQKKMREMTGVKNPQVTQNIKQAVFVGTNSDFIKSRKEQLKNKENDG